MLYSMNAVSHYTTISERTIRTSLIVVLHSDHTVELLTVEPRVGCRAVPMNLPDRLNTLVSQVARRYLDPQHEFLWVRAEGRRME